MNRVETTGGVEGVSIGSPSLDRETVAAFNSETKDYLKELKNETFLGNYQEIQGLVYRLYPGSKIVTIRRAGESTASIFLNNADFNQIRYDRQTNPLVRFKGRPIFKFGIETSSITEFEADEIEFIENDE